MVGIRWLAAIAFAFAACVAAPDASAQTWLRWSKAPAGQPADPSKRVVPIRHPAITVPATVVPVPPAAMPPSTPRGPTVTIIEEAPHADAIAPRIDPPAIAIVAEPLPPASAPTLHAPAAPLPIATNVAMPSATAATAAIPVSAEPPCHDCATVEELKATAARPERKPIAPDGQKLQSELKRKLLQTR